MHTLPILLLPCLVARRSSVRRLPLPHNRDGM